MSVQLLLCLEKGGKTAPRFFWIDWKIEGGPAIRPWGPGAKGLPLTFGNAKRDIYMAMGRGFRGKYIRRGLKHLTMRDVDEQEEARQSV